MTVGSKKAGERDFPAMMHALLAIMVVHQHARHRPERTLERAYDFPFLPAKQGTLPCSSNREQLSKLLRIEGFQLGRAWRFPAFCQNLPAFPKNAGRDRVQPRIVSNWRRRFADHGLGGLKDRPRTGKKPSNNSTSLAKSASERVSRSTL
jgi:hypothetical protein